MLLFSSNEWVEEVTKMAKEIDCERVSRKQLF